MITANALRALMLDLPHLAHGTRRQRRLSIRAAADQVGIAMSTLSRVENGYYCDVQTLIRLLDWAGR